MKLSLCNLYFICSRQVAYITPLGCSPSLDLCECRMVSAPGSSFSWGKLHKSSISIPHLHSTSPTLQITNKRTTFTKPLKEIPRLDLRTSLASYIYTPLLFGYYVSPKLVWISYETEPWSNNKVQSCLCYLQVTHWSSAIRHITSLMGLSLDLRECGMLSAPGHLFHSIGPISGSQITGTKKKPSSSYTSITLIWVLSKSQTNWDQPCKSFILISFKITNKRTNFIQVNHKLIKVGLNKSSISNLLGTTSKQNIIFTC